MVFIYSVNWNQFQEAIAAKKKIILTAKNRVKRLEKTQAEMVIANEVRKERQKKLSRKRKFENSNCSGTCRNKRHGCESCRLQDIGKRLKIATDEYEEHINQLKHFEENVQVAPTSNDGPSVPNNLPPTPNSNSNAPSTAPPASAPVTPPNNESDDSIVLIPLDEPPKQEPSSDSSMNDSSELAMMPDTTDESINSLQSDEQEANNSYSEMVERNLAQDESDDGNEDYVNESSTEDDSSEEDSSDNDSNDAVSNDEASFEMWMPAIDADDADAAAQQDEDADATNQPAHGWCYFCNDYCKEVVFCPLAYF